MNPMVLYMEEKYRNIMLPILEQHPFSWDALHKLKLGLMGKV